MLPVGAAPVVHGGRHAATESMESAFRSCPSSLHRMLLCPWRAAYAALAMEPWNQMDHTSNTLGGAVKGE